MSTIWSFDLGKADHGLALGGKNNRAESFGSARLKENAFEPVLPCRNHL